MARLRLRLLLPLPPLPLVLSPVLDKVSMLLVLVL
jgi:hypothetical protein